MSQDCGLGMRIAVIITIILVSFVVADCPVDCDEDEAEEYLGHPTNYRNAHLLPPKALQAAWDIIPSDQYSVILSENPKVWKNLDSGQQNEYISISGSCRCADCCREFMGSNDFGTALTNENVVGNYLNLIGDTPPGSPSEFKADHPDKVNDFYNKLIEARSPTGRKAPIDFGRAIASGGQIYFDGGNPGDFVIEIGGDNPVNIPLTTIGQSDLDALFPVPPSDDDDGSLGITTPDGNNFYFKKATPGIITVVNNNGFPSTSFTSPFAFSLTANETVDPGDVILTPDIPFEASLTTTKRIWLETPEATFITLPDCESYNCDFNAFSDAALEIIGEAYYEAYPDEAQEIIGSRGITPTEIQLQVLGDAYLELLKELKDQGIITDLDQLVNVLKNESLYREAELINSLTVLRSQQKGTIKIKKDDILVNGSIATETPYWIIIPHDGAEYEITDTYIRAPYATMFWNLIYYNDDLSYIESENVVKGDWIAFKQGNTITSIIVRPTPNNRALLHNNDASIYMRGDDAFEVDFVGSNITHVKTNGSGIKEIYFGKQIQNGIRYHYVRGQEWELHFNKTAVESGDARDLIFELTETRFVHNISLQSRDSLYRYLPQEYEVRSSEHGQFEDKLICLLNCDEVRSNSIKVNDDEGFGLFSLGNMNNTIISYEGNRREVFDEHIMIFEKNDVDEFSTSFVAPDQNSITYVEEQDLLLRLDEEAKRDLSRRESLRQHKELYYQNALPASFTSMDSNVVFLNHGTFSLNLFSYISDRKRKLVLNRDSYNTFVELALQDQAYLSTFTYVEHDGVIRYLLNPDLSMNPEMYDTRISFQAPAEVVAKYGEIKS